MQIKKVSYLLLTFLLVTLAGKAQLSAFGFSSIGSTNGAIVSTNPVLVAGSAKCLAVSGGAAPLNIANNGTGLFGSGCVETAPAADTTSFSLSLNVYPNPTRGAAIIKASGSFDQNLASLVRVIAVDGKVMFNQMVPMSSIKAGYTINASSYAAGNYNVVIELMNKRYTLRLIKL